MGATLFTSSVCLVSRGEVVMTAGSKIISTFSKDLTICPAASMDQPIPEAEKRVCGCVAQYGVKRLYPPLYKLAIVPTPYVVVGPTEW